MFSLRQQRQDLELGELAVTLIVAFVLSSDPARKSISLRCIMIRSCESGSEIFACTARSSR